MILRRFVFLLLLGAACPASAAVTITFYSHEFGDYFPHAFITLEGAPDGGGAAVSASYGFTARRISPALLLGSVDGEVQPAEPAYIATSQPHWRMVLSDGQYAQIVTAMEKWRATTRRAYNLKRRNCVHFVADMARTLGLDVVETKALMQRPRSFLDDILRRNRPLATASGDSAVPMLVTADGNASANRPQPPLDTGSKAGSSIPIP
jgi:hypothetical protein